VTLDPVQALGSAYGDRDASDGAPAERVHKTRRGSALRSVPPPAGATTGELLGWLTEQLRLPSPAVRVRRYGATSDSPVAVSLEDGRRLRFDTAGDLLSPTRLVQVVIFALGADAPQLPTFTKADAQDVDIVAVRASEAVEAHDARTETADWQDQVLRICQAVHQGDYTDPAARWAALSWLAGVPDFDPRAGRLAFEDAHYRAPMLVWADGSAYLRVADVERYVRGFLHQPGTTGQLVGRMKEAGWEHRRAEARRPGAGRGRTATDRVRVSVFVVPPPASGANRACPQDPPGENAHAHARARVYASGTPGDTCENAVAEPDTRAGDTSRTGDTNRRGVA
jgi:hypothetical protein